MLHLDLVPSRSVLHSLGAMNKDGSEMRPSLPTYAAVGAAAVLGGTTRGLLSTAFIVGANAP